MLTKETHNTGNVWTHHFPRHHLLAACGISLAATLLLSVLPDSVVAYRVQELEPSPAPAVTPAIETPAAEITTAPVEIDPWLHLTVRKGDTLSSLLQKTGLDTNAIHELTNSSKDAQKLASLNLGDELDVLMKDGAVQELRLRRSKLDSLSVTRTGDKYESKQVTLIPEVRYSYAAGTIDSSLFLAGQKAGLNDRMTLKLADIFAYDVDFLQDIQQGDSFALLYEELYLDGQSIGQGNIVSAEFTNQGKTYRAVQYTNKNGTTSYYTPDGNIMRKQFLRTPVDFAKVTSYFSLNRKHPILHKIRAHKGIDYGAPTGTPIRAAGDGTVVFAGVRNGFGNVVMIQHGGVYTTLYGHMSKIGVKKGARVNQGQVIGAVGMTGLASGPHLHYEFHVNGTAVNPLANMNVAMAEPLSKTEKANFDKTTAALFSQMKEFAAGTIPQKSQQVALGDTDKNREPQIR
ncbi:MAG: peptidoglycan DD-metalloendopeptidase family protein [Cellvibrionales bacterium]|jgi:murein DD-endopeptidase MepM/ murein hydrolase activator NlpD|nr:peptidoglycan DD-metalloendopeptidase family protein [Cellvibrionales bacterium]